MVVFESIGEGLSQTIETMLTKADVCKRPGLCVISPAYQGFVPEEPCDVMFLPGERANDILKGAKYKYAVTYGYSQRDTLSLSSFGMQRAVLDVRRELPLQGGKFYERGEIPLGEVGNLAPLHLMAAAGTLLLSGGHILPESGIYIHH